MTTNFRRLIDNKPVLGGIVAGIVLSAGAYYLLRRRSTKIDEPSPQMEAGEFEPMA